MDNNETNTPSTSDDIAEKPCDICGKSVFVWGTLITRGIKTPENRLFFRPSGSTFEDGDFGIEARYCQRCGNIKIFGSI